MKIMVVDDDQAILDCVRLLLELNNYQVITISDGRIENKVKREKPDLILLDVWMSGVDGRDVCKSLKQNKEFKGIPIIMFSASKDVAESVDSVGADDFIEKPFEIDELLNKIEKYIRREVIENYSM